MGPPPAEERRPAPRKHRGQTFSMDDRVANARRDGPRDALDQVRSSMLDVAPAPGAGDPTIVVSDGWDRRGGGSIDEAGGALKWSRTIGAAGWDSIQQVVRYDADEVLVVGWVEGAVDFGGACGEVKPGLRSPGVPYIYTSFVARLDTTGACNWADSFDSDDAWPIAATVDAAGNFYVAGMFDTEVRFGGAFDLETTGNAYDVFLARYDSGNNLTWTRSITGTSDSWAYDLIPFEDGGSADVVLVGAFDGVADLEGTVLTSAGSYDMLVARYTDAGALSFAAGFGGTGDDEACGVGLAGSTLVVGGYFDSASVTVPGQDALTNAGGYDGVLLGLSAAGAPSWAKSFGDTNDDSVYDVASAAGSAAVVGAFEGTIAIGGLADITAAGVGMFVAKVGSGGAGEWSYAVSSANGVAYATSVRANGAGDVFVAGAIDGEASFGTTVLTPAVGSWSIFTARYASAGGETPTWAAERDGAGSSGYPLIDLTDTRLILATDATGNAGDLGLYGLQL